MSDIDSLMYKFHNSGDIDVSMAYEFFFFFFGQYILPEDHFLKSIMGFDCVIVKPSYYSLWTDKKCGNIDVGFYTQPYWVPKTECDKHSKLYENGKGVDWSEEDYKFDEEFYDKWMSSKNTIVMEDIIQKEGIDGLCKNWRLQTLGPKNKFFEFTVKQTGWG